MSHRKAACDHLALTIAVLLLIAGIAFVYSASAEFAIARAGSTEQLAFNHSIRVGISLVLMYIFSRLDYHFLLEFSRPLLLLSIVLLVFVLIRGVELKGALRWLDIGGISLQPSELAKFALLFHISVRISLLEAELLNWKRAFLQLVGWITLTVLLIALQPNLSTAFLIFMLALTVLLIGGARLSHLAVLALCGLVLASFYAISAPYRLERLTAYFVRDNIESYQLEQALIGFANGGLVGVGPGQSRQRDLFLPEPFGDFIVSIIGEEYGFIGIVALLVCYGIIFVRGIAIANAAPDILGYLLAWSICLVIGGYALINIAVSCGLLPTTGIPLPLVSYGGSSIVVTASAVGVLLNISRQTTRDRLDESTP